MDENSISGVVNNVKGILHEYEWVSMENSDGDSIDTGAFAVKRYLKVVIDLASNSGNNRPCLRFNGDDDPNYSDR